jgi:mono/diheme cytochrome c family protein
MSPRTATSVGNASNLALGLALVLALIATGCRQNMHNQARLKTNGESDFFADGHAARPIPANTVARGQLRENVAVATGLGADGLPVTEIPLPVNRELLVRGHQRFNVFCAPCHGQLGDGKGMIVQRGFKQPVSFHDPRLRESAVGYFFNTMTEGFGQMPSYASQIPVEDRWAIAAFVRALQYSQNASLADLTAEEKAKLDQAWKAAEEAATAKTQPHETRSEH